jgi:UDP-N-acetylmuramoyl-tripeptide--D-alanyl-D-alanine ligase
VGHIGSIQGIQQAKGELIEALDATSVAIVNADDPRALALGRRAPGRLLTFGQAAEADIRGWVHADCGLEGVLCTLVIHHTAYEVALPVLGAHQVLNALAAAAVGVALHVPAADIVAGLQSYHGMYGRMMPRRGAGSVTLIDDTYNASPQSMRVALQCLGHTPVTGRRLAVLGDMLELGDRSPALHEEVGVLVAQSGVHALITFGPLAQYIAQGAQDAGMSPAAIHTTMHTEDAVTLLRSLRRAGDVMLLKGSRGMAMERLVQALTEPEGDG